MSTQAIIQFIRQVEKDPRMQTQFKRATAGKSGREVLSAFVNLGAQAGYAFTVEDVLQMRSFLLSRMGRHDAWSPDELDRDAGGGSVELTISVLGSALKNWFGP